jgi:hypothetical protein
LSGRSESDQVLLAPNSATREAGGALYFQSIEAIKLRASHLGCRRTGCFVRVQIGSIGIRSGSRSGAPEEFNLLATRIRRFPPLDHGRCFT